MESLPYYSVEYDLLYRTLPADVGVHRNKRSHKRIERFTYTQAAAGTLGDAVYLCKVPGVCRILLPELFIYFTDWDTSTVVSIGWDAYTEVDGDAVAADPDGLVNDLDVSQGGVGVFFGMMALVGTTSTLTIDPAAKIDHEFNSRHPVSITATFTGAAPTADDILSGYVTYCI